MIYKARPGSGEKNNKAELEGKSKVYKGKAFSHTCHVSHSTVGVILDDVGVEWFCNTIMWYWQPFQGWLLHVITSHI